MSMKTMAIVAATLGIGTILSLLLAVSHIVSEIRSIDNELIIEMDSFKVKSSDLWKNMIAMGAKDRQRRQSYYQSAAPEPSQSYTEAHPPSQPPPASYGILAEPTGWLTHLQFFCSVLGCFRNESSRMYLFSFVESKNDTAYARKFHNF
ncbi:unnamed protein product [Toxocara canis]|uniref:Col_cuticle_N domain-containing protein n=1 Tax=Toxocara canis TaxID=6265 RepID=A0A183U6E3_TOXCA|nr:unnamed protein product [Toxocara canis]